MAQRLIPRPSIRCAWRVSVLARQRIAAGSGATATSLKRSATQSTRNTKECWSGSAESSTQRSLIDRKDVDFLLCDPTTMKPRCGIELDDSSHARRDRQERDGFVDAVFQVAGLPLVRFPAQASYDANAIAAELARHLGTQPVVAPRVAVAQSQTGSPLCPKCNLPMVQRTAKGRNAGQQFWGCPNYPKCRETG